MKRNIQGRVGVIAAGVLAISLSACAAGDNAAGGNTATELSADPVTIRMNWWGGDGRHQRTKEAIDLFEKKYPNITVEPEFSDWSGYWEKLATATAGKNSADVIQMDQLYLASYASRGALVDLNDFEIDSSGMEPSVLGMGEWDSGQYAIPISTASTAILVNTDLLEKLGVPLPENSDSWTWDEFGAWAKQVTDASPAGTYGASIMNSEYHLQLFARQRGDDLFDGAKVAIKPATLEAYFQELLDWTTSGAASPASVSAETAKLAVDQQPFAVGTVATTFGTATMISAFTNASGANIDILPIPSLSDGVEDFDYFKPGMYWSLSSQSKHPAEAAALINFLLTDPEALTLIGTERGLPANAKTLEIVRADLTPEETEAVDYAEARTAFLSDAPAAIVPSGASDIDAVLMRYTQEVTFERQTPADAAKSMIADLQASIEQAN